MAAVFSMQGIGQLSAALVAIIVIRIFKGAIEEDYMNVDYVWRICLGLGMRQERREGKERRHSIIIF